MKIFKGIFDNNSKDLVTTFFKHQAIRKIWHPYIFQHLTEDICFKNCVPKDEIMITYREISRIMTEKFKLSMPQWWLDKFPIIAKAV
jgi:hypothetical protein